LSNLSLSLLLLLIIYYWALYIWAVGFFCDWVSHPIYSLLITSAWPAIFWNLHAIITLFNYDDELILFRLDMELIAFVCDFLSSAQVDQYTIINTIKTITLWKSHQIYYIGTTHDVYLPVNRKNWWEHSIIWNYYSHAGCRLILFTSLMIYYKL